MTGHVAIVTDSTAYLADEVTASRSIMVVPLQVVLDGVAFEEGSEISVKEVAEALRRRARVSTSRPSPRRFLDAYEAAAAGGASGIVSIHLSAEVSGTVDAARLAAREAPIPVAVVDSRSIAMGLGFSVLAAADAAERGLPLDQVAEAARSRAARCVTFFYVATLEFLRRGGRIGAAEALIGTALAVKPLLHLVDGRIQPLEKVRTTSRALDRLEQLAVECAGSDPVDVAVHHLADEERAGRLAAHLTARLPKAAVSVSEIGAVIGAHTGPGMLGVVIAPR